MIPTAPTTFDELYESFLVNFHENEDRIKFFSAADLHDLYPSIFNNSSIDREKPAKKLQISFNEMISKINEVTPPGEEDHQKSIIYGWCQSIKKIIDEESQKTSLMRKNPIPNRVDFTLMMRFLTVTDHLSTLALEDDLNDFLYPADPRGVLTQLINQIQFSDPLYQKDSKTTSFAPVTLEHAKVLAEHLAMVLPAEQSEPFLSAIALQVHELKDPSVADNYKMHLYFLEQFHEAIENKIRQDEELVPLKTEQDLLFEKLFKKFTEIARSSGISIQKSDENDYQLNFQSSSGENLATCTVDEDCRVVSKFEQYPPEMQEMMPSLIRAQLEIAPKSVVSIEFECKTTEDVQLLFDLTKSICAENPEIFNILKFNVKTELANATLSSELEDFIKGVLSNNFSSEIKEKLKAKPSDRLML